MKIPRREVLHSALGMACLLALPRGAAAQAYPARPVHLIVTTPAGGSPDIIGRLVGQWLSERFGQPFVVEDRTGASGNIGTEFVVRSPPDGYTLLLALSGNAINAALYKNVNFNFIADTAPVASVATIPLVMEVTPSLPVKSVAEFIAYAKAHPGKLNAASGGTGSPQHVAAELFDMMAGTKMTPRSLPRRGPGAAGSDERTGPGHVRRHACVARLHQSRQAAGAGGDRRDASGGIAGPAGRRRISAGLRGERLVRHRRAQSHAPGHCR